MLKKLTAVLLTASATAGIAGLVDHGDYTNFPNVNVDAHLRLIACKYFPEIRKTLPLGLPRRQAWTQDIKQAAGKLNIPPAGLDKLIKSVLDPKDAPLADAPHPDLEEFVLYVKGYRELFKNSEVKDFIPENWKKLLAMPIEKRRYTTIPVLYATYRSFAFKQNNTFEKTLEDIKSAIKDSCYDSQGCLLALIKDSAGNPEFCTNKILGYKRAFRKLFANYDPVKQWRYTNEHDTFSWSFFRGDKIYVGENAQLPDLIYALYTAPVESLAYYAVMDESLRDLIVAVCLTNRNFSDAKRSLAFKLAPASKINYPVLALRLPPEEAQKLLQNHQEFDRLRELLQLKRLSGEAKIAAIDNYISKYPDYTPQDMPKTSLALNTHAELHALAGAELFKLGRPYEAAERWLKGCTPEDIGMVAEQVMSIDELIKFCDKHFPQGVAEEQNISSVHCVKNNKLLYPVFLQADQLNFALRNLLARRLMRASRQDEAEKYFTGHKTRILAKKYFYYRQILNNSSAPMPEKVAATLNLASLVRRHGDKLFGTFLEPDNLICHNDYPCQWGTRQKAVKLNKPDLPRYSYRYRAAELYARAATMTNDKKLQSHAWWMAGTLLKNRAPQQADIYLKQLLQVAPELTVKNWFIPKKSAPTEVQEFYERRFFSDKNIEDTVPPEPEITPVKITEKITTAQELFEAGHYTIINDDDHLEPIRYAMYTFKLAGDKGSVEGDIWSSSLQYIILDDYEAALWFLRRAEKQAPNNNKVKHELAYVYSVLGYWPQAVKLFKHVAENEKQDKEILALAYFNLGRIYSEGALGEKRNIELGKQYLREAAKLDPKLAEKYSIPEENQENSEEK